ncbi:MAG: patatin, partial [Cyanobacteria bacterium P01_F01_bin.3]
FGKCLHGDILDREVGKLTATGLRRPVADPLFTYVRYNAELTRSGLNTLGLNKVRPEDVQKLDSVKAIPELSKVGRAVAKTVVAAHFRGFI